MTDDEIIKMLKEIDMCTHTYDNGMHIITTYDITKMRRFAERVTAAEREACAKVCDAFEMQGQELWDRTADPEAQGRSIGASDCAAAIRARGKT